MTKIFNLHFNAKLTSYLHTINYIFKTMNSSSINIDLQEKQAVRIPRKGKYQFKKKTYRNTKKNKIRQQGYDNKHFIIGINLPDVLDQSEYNDDDYYYDSHFPYDYYDDYYDYGMDYYGCVGCPICFQTTYGSYGRVTTRAHALFP